MKITEHRIAFEKIVEALQAGQNQQAIAIAEEAYRDFPLEKADTLYWKACLYGSVGNSDEVILCFEEALENGIWWSQKTMLNEEDLKAVLAEGRFNSLRQSMAELEEEARSSAQIKTWIVGNTISGDMTVHLHWKNDTLAHYTKYFEGIYETLGQRCLFIQSNQVDSSKGFCWDDEEKSQSEVKQVLTHNLYKPNSFTGSSQGGRIALKLAIEYAVDYVGIMPAIRDLSIFDGSIPKDMKFKFIIGDQDFFYLKVKEFHVGLVERGFESRLEVIQGVGHYFSPELLVRLIETLGENHD